MSCNSPLDKSVFEPLTIDELQTTMDKDSQFISTYNRIIYIRDTLLTSDVEKAKYADLTYNRIYDFVKFSNDSNYFNPIESNLKKEWDSKYGIYKEQIDSVSNYWKKQQEENSLESYVKIELEDIKTTYYAYSEYYKQTFVGFKLTPLKGRIDYIRFSYKLEPKINEDNLDAIPSMFTPYFVNTPCISIKPFSSPIVRYWDIIDKYKSIFEENTVSSLLKKYNIKFLIWGIQNNGEYIFRDELEIPRAIQLHWLVENRESINDLFYDAVVREVLHKEYVREDEYVILEKHKILKENDSLVFEFLNYN